MYQVLVKDKLKNHDYQPIRKSKFRNYDRAYAYIGDLLQVKDTLHWGGRLKHMEDGYDRKKLIRYGNTYFRRKNLQFKIVYFQK
jgi:hypothetical protein